MKNRRNIHIKIESFLLNLYNQVVRSFFLQMQNPCSIESNCQRSIPNQKIYYFLENIYILQSKKTDFGVVLKKYHLPIVTLEHDNEVGWLQTVFFCLLQG